VSDAIAIYAAAVSTVVAGWQAWTWRVDRRDRRAANQIAFGTNLRIQELAPRTKGADLLELQVRIVNDSNHDVAVRHAILRWGNPEPFDFSDGWPSEVELHFGRQWLRVAEEVDERGHGCQLEHDQIIGAHRGVKTSFWAAKNYWLANAGKPVALRLTTDTGMPADSRPQTWEHWVVGQEGWEYLRQPYELPPYTATTI
jgi:hypothetical protein